MNFKKFIALGLAICASFAPCAFADEQTQANTSVFSDVDEDTQTGKAILQMYEYGYLKGYNDGTFKPNATITRAELTRVFNQVFKYELDEEKAENMQNFYDNTDADAWYYNDVRIAQSNGYINGFDDFTFRPQENFTRQQTCVVLDLAAKLDTSAEADYSDVVIADEVSEWADKYVKAAVAAKAFDLELGNTFRAKQNITRGEVCLALSKFIVVETEVVTDAAGEAVTNAEGETETVTRVSVNTENKSSGGGGGGGSSSKDKTETNTKVIEPATQTTTEKVTSATTEATTETTTEAKSSGGNTTPENPKLTDAENQALLRVIRVTQNTVIPNCKSGAMKNVGETVLESMKAYYNDNSYDIGSAITEALDMYHSLSAEERTEFKRIVMSSYNTYDISILRNVFAPFLNI